MPTSKICLPDVNFWLALVSARHIHNSIAVQWFAQLGVADAAMCRITQMGLLRLLTNARVMGADVIGQSAAWDVYLQLMSDSRVRFLSEPADIEAAWRKLTRKAHPATNVWTDAYLLAFADLSELQVVTFDQAFRRLAGSRAVELNQGSRG